MESPLKMYEITLMCIQHELIQMVCGCGKVVVVHYGYCWSYRNWTVGLHDQNLKELWQAIMLEEVLCLERAIPES